MVAIHKSFYRELYRRINRTIVTIVEITATLSFMIIDIVFFPIIKKTATEI